MNLFFSKIQWSSQQWNIPYFLKRRTTWNDLQQVRIDLKRPTKSKKRFGTTGNGLKQPRVSKKDMKRPTVSKKRPETTCKKQILTSWNPSTWKIINWRAPMSQTNNRSIPCLQYFVSSVHICEITAGRKITANIRTKRSEAKKYWITVWLASSLL